MVSPINRWLIGTRGYDPDTKIAIMALGLELPRRDALELAAWIAVVADRPTGTDPAGPPGSEFEEILHAIETGDVKAPVPVEAVVQVPGHEPDRDYHAVGIKHTVGSADYSQLIEPCEPVCGFSTSPGYFCKLPEGHPGAHRGTP